MPAEQELKQHNQWSDKPISKLFVITKQEKTASEIEPAITKRPKLLYEKEYTYNNEEEISFHDLSSTLHFKSHGSYKEESCMHNNEEIKSDADPMCACGESKSFLKQSSFF